MDDNELFHEFHDRYSKILLGYAVNCAYGDKSDAEDALQQCFLECFQKIIEVLRTDDPINPILSYLFRRINSRVRDMRDKRFFIGRDKKPRMIASTPEELSIASNPEELAKFQDSQSAPAPDEIAGRKADWAKILTNCRPTLSATEKKVFQLTVLEEPPVSDDNVAKTLGSTSQAIKTTRCRAIAKLRKYLDPNGAGRPNRLP